MGRKEVRKEPNCFPSSHLCAPERGFRPRTPVAAAKLCLFKGTVDSRRGGGKEAGSGLGAAGSVEKGRSPKSRRYLRLWRPQPSPHPHPTPASPARARLPRRLIRTVCLGLYQGRRWGGKGTGAF